MYDNLFHPAIEDAIKKSLPDESRRQVQGLPQLPPEYRPYFEVRWLATVEECREFRNLAWALGEHNASLLSKYGCVPEILALDYSLSANRHTVRKRLQDAFGDTVDKNELTRVEDMLSPLRKIRCATTQMWPKGNPPFMSVDDDEGAMTSKTIPRDVLSAVEGRKKHADDPSDYWGCFVGALLLSDFADHPCAPVTITRYSSKDFRTEVPDVWLIEWLMAMQTGGQLKGQGLSMAKWEHVVSPGVKSLRKRIAQLARLGMVSVDLRQCANVASGHKEPAVTFASRYGTRRLPVDGLFIDDPSYSRQWANDLLKQLVAPGNWTALTEAWDHADRLLKRYDQEELVWERIELSNLLRKKEKGDNLSKDDNQRLTALKNTFSAVVTEGKNGKGETLINGELHNMDLVADIRHLEVDDWTRKWTALIVILKLLKRFSVGWREGMPFEDITEPEVYLALCPVARNPIILPFSEGSNRSIAAHMQDVDRKVGFSIKHVLSGRGLSASERTLLMHVASTLGLGRDLWEEFPRIDCIVRGDVGNE